MYNVIEKIKKHGLSNSSKIILEKIIRKFFFLEKLRYKLCLKKNKIYFGPVFAALQGHIDRHYYMDNLVKNEAGKDKPGGAEFRILEIGSWAGGSAITFAEALKKYNHGEGKVFCIDPWQDYFDLTIDNGEVYKKMKDAVKNDKIFELFLHNIRASKNDHLVIPLRAYSNQILPIFKERSFDIIFIDGDHSYEAVYQDILNSSKLVVEGGVICGDDLELQYHQINTDKLEERRHLDFMFDDNTGRDFHPGVTSAVWEFFHKEVSCYEGFWAMRRSGADWEEVTLDAHVKNFITLEHFKA